MFKRNLIVLVKILLVVIVISACGSMADENTTMSSESLDEEDNFDIESENNNDQNNSDEKDEIVNNIVPDENNKKDDDNKRDKNELSDYTAEEIEYARIWLQLGLTQDIDELNVQSISAGDLLNPDDTTSVEYPEDVVQLTTSRLVEGSITYSSNGDGTIKLYTKVPQRWDGENPAGENVYQEIIEATEKKSIDTGDNEKIEQLITKINIIN